MLDKYTHMTQFEGIQPEKAAALLVLTLDMLMPAVAWR